MRLLLDTHIVLWWRMNDERLREEAREAIAVADVAWVSAASAWEVAIKVSVGKLTLPEPFEVGVTESGFDTLDIKFSHGRAAGELPMHHRDPFDRMLIAQARAEDLTLVTHDRRFADYDVHVVWS